MGLSGELEEEEEEEDPRRAKRKGDEFLPGDWVQHPLWGEGKIRRITGSGKNAIATIEFDVEFGTKRVSLAVAPLERI
jgi:hypothetical protein